MCRTYRNLLWYGRADWDRVYGRADRDRLWYGRADRDRLWDYMGSNGKHMSGYITRTHSCDNWMLKGLL